jgi:hypothetical protein
VDFAVFHPDLSPTHPLAVIETDGHEFHTRTPEQVSKDRWRERMIQRLCLGVPVLRYPGVDAVRRTDECVEEIAEFIDMILERTGLHHGYSPVRLFDGRSPGAAQVP